MLAMLLTAAFARADIKPFNSDGCSGFPEGTAEQQELWLHCCQQHDLAYWRGGTYTERVAADEALQACVAQVGEPVIAELMLVGVRVGGSAYFPTRFRWGYGWRYFRGYKALSENEQEQVQDALKRHDDTRSTDASD